MVAPTCVQAVFTNWAAQIDAHIQEAGVQTLVNNSGSAASLVAQRYAKGIPLRTIAPFAIGQVLAVPVQGVVEGVGSNPD